MALRRFYITPEFIGEEAAQLPADQAHHLRDVLRIRAGERVEIFDGAGHGYSGEVEFRGTEVFICRLNRLPFQTSPVRLILAAALIKPAKFEWILEKATELGVDEILPLKTGFSEIRIPEDKIADRLHRWDRIVQEASKQCRRFASPRVHAPLSFEDSLIAEEFSSCAGILLYEKSPDLWRPDATMMSDGVILWVGPEGGWETREIELAEKAGCNIVDLGPLILRAETAAIAAVSILQHQVHISRQPAAGSEPC
jgi:16S rRNA (uracil1498-N3)-methyltransferase